MIPQKWIDWLDSGWTDSVVARKGSLAARLFKIRDWLFPNLGRLPAIDAALERMEEQDKLRKEPGK